MKTSIERVTVYCLIVTTLIVFLIPCSTSADEVEEVEQDAAGLLNGIVDEIDDNVPDDEQDSDDEEGDEVNSAAEADDEDEDEGESEDSGGEDGKICLDSDQMVLLIQTITATVEEKVLSNTPYDPLTDPKISSFWQ